MSYIIGFITVFIAIVAFAISLIPTKHYDIGHGMYYQLMVCIGIWIVSIIVQLIQNSSFESFAMIGGMIWVFGNLTVFIIIRYIGLSLGMLIWGITSMIIGWSIGFFGLLGIMQQIINMRDLNIASICVIAFAILLMYFIKPELKIPVTFVQRIIGYTSAIVAGVLYGFNTLPSKYLSERIGHSSHLIDYIFSHSTGIIVTSTGAYLIYWICCPKRYHESVSYRKLTIPALLSGIVWSVGNVCIFIAIEHIGYIIAIPLITVGPGVLMSIIMIIHYGEISGIRNQIILVLAIIISIGGMVMNSLSLVL